MTQLQLYDALVSLHASVHAPAGDVRYWSVQEAIPEPASAAVPLITFEPPNGEPGSVTVALLGAVLSTRMLVTLAEVVLWPAPSTAVARAS